MTVRASKVNSDDKPADKMGVVALVGKDMLFSASPTVLGSAFLTVGVLQCNDFPRMTEAIVSNLNDEFFFKIDGGNQKRFFKIGKDDSREEITGCADGGVSITEVDHPKNTETGDDAHDIFYILSADSARMNAVSEDDDNAADSDNDEDCGSGREGIDCFLSSACLAARGLPDTCEKLTILRHFRDTYMATTEYNRRLIDEYYNIAPSLVKKINTLPNAETIWLLIYEGLVVPTVNLIKKSRFEEAIEHYRSFTARLVAAISKH